VKRIVYLEPWMATDSELLKAQYRELAEHLCNNNPRNFERLERQADAVIGTHEEIRLPVLDDHIDEFNAEVAKRAAAKAAQELAAPTPATRPKTAAKRKPRANARTAASKS
jgi:hypothetical protein